LGTFGALAKAVNCFGDAFCLASFRYPIYKVFCQAFFQKSDRFSLSNCDFSGRDKKDRQSAFAGLRLSKKAQTAL